MNSKYPSPLVIFPEDAFKAINAAESKFHYWLILQSLMRDNYFKEDSMDTVLDHYKSDKIAESFIDLQLKFFIVRNSEYDRNNLRDVISYWVSCAKNIFPQYNFKLDFTEILSLFQNSLKQYGKYYYDFDLYKDYIKQWNKCTVELKTWKRFSLLEIPQDFNFMAQLFEDEDGLKFPIGHMRKLFDEYVVELYKNKFEPRLKSKILADRDRIIIDRVIQNIGSKEDKIYLNRQFLNFYSWRIVSENISKCLANEVSISELDIHSQTHFANYFALIKYYEVLNGKSDKKPKEKLAMWFKSLPKDPNQKAEVFEELKNVFDMIQLNCPKSTWGDFKSIFSEAGASVKIEWVGDASLLNYIFRKLNNVLSFKGNKWEIVAHYFYRSDKNDTTIDADRLINNSHYKIAENVNLGNRLDDLISTLSN